MPGWTAWHAPSNELVKGRLAFLAAAAARRLGGFEALHWELLCARHERRRRLDDEAVVRQAAEAVGIPWDRLRAALQEPWARELWQEEHELGVSLGVFGTPTFVFAGGESAYLKIRPAPSGEEAARFFDELSATIRERGYLRELKRPVAVPRPG